MHTHEDSYRMYAPVYDRLNGSREARIWHIQCLIDQYAPRAHTILELACGTGSILEGLRPGYELTGLDISPAMLKVARQKLPTVHFVQTSMTHFALKHSFDVIFCTFNSLNHLLTLEDWQATFESAAKHLRKGGIFLFDVSTYERLAEASTDAPRTAVYPDNERITTYVSKQAGGQFTWHLKVERAGQPERTERVLLQTFPPEQIVQMLRPNFTAIAVPSDPHQVTAEDKGRSYYVCKKR